MGPTEKHICPGLNDSFAVLHFFVLLPENIMDEGTDFKTGRAEPFPS